MLKRWCVALGFLALVFVLSRSLLAGIIPEAQPLFTKNEISKTKVETLTYIAIGDSLTEGVGDTTNQGGFVPLLSQRLTSQYGSQVVASNYGKAGNTSKQILKRMRENEDIKTDLAKADVMTLTVGGNDVMAVIRKNLSKLTLSSFTQPSQAYQQRLRQIIALARRSNPDLPIYILGIYNPFYLNFSEVTEMQTVIDNWNKSTEAVTKEYSKVYFVPINDILYRGLEGEEAIVQEESEGSSTDDLELFADTMEQEDTTSTSSNTGTISGASKAQALNNLLSDDYFHPNNTGYQLMTNAVMEAILETKEDWE